METRTITTYEGFADVTLQKEIAEDGSFSVLIHSFGFPDGQHEEEMKHETAQFKNENDADDFISKYPKTKANNLVKKFNLIEEPPKEVFNEYELLAESEETEN